MTLEVNDIGKFLQIMNNARKGQWEIDEWGHKTWHPNPDFGKLNKSQVEQVWQECKKETV